MAGYTDRGMTAKEVARQVMAPLPDDRERWADLIAKYKAQLPNGTPEQIATLKEQAAAMEDPRKVAMTIAMEDLGL